MFTTCDCNEQINSIDFRLGKEVVIKNNCAGGGTTVFVNPNYDPDLDPNNYPDNSEIQQFENDYRNRMSNEEKIIFNEMSRLDQLKYLYNAKTASSLAESLFPNSLHNGQGDAFRHALFNALNAKVLGISLSTTLADAHELAQGQDPLEKQMDLFNNQVGRNIFLDLQSRGLSGHFFQAGVIFQLNLLISDGQLRMISPLSSQGDVIPGVSQLVPTY